MVRNDGAETRLKRLNDMAKHINAALFAAKERGQNFIPLRKIIIEIIFKTGLTEARVREYLVFLAEKDGFIMDEEKDQIRRDETES